MSTQYPGVTKDVADFLAACEKHGLSVRRNPNGHWKIFREGTTDVYFHSGTPSDPREKSR